MRNNAQQVFENIQKKFGNQLQSNVALSNYSTAHVGGNAAWLMRVKNEKELTEIVQLCWENQIKFFILGSGSNTLFSDNGFDGLVILNHAKKIQIYQTSDNPYISAESGANLGLIARKAALAGLAGLEWASTIPGTLGGALYGNAGAHDGEISDNLLLAEILQQNIGKTIWRKKDFQYSYRGSILKRHMEQGVILSATLNCKYDDPEKIKERMNKFIDHRRRTQPPGASMGSMFKNPTDDYAGRLIEAAGLKGYTIGGVKVSEVHANFFVNSDQATASDIYKLVQHVQRTIKQKFEVDLELEVEMIGFNQIANNNTLHQGNSAI
jgi:UDP-N-acetylmuramate dehydrogenase